MTSGFVAAAVLAFLPETWGATADILMAGGWVSCRAAMSRPISTAMRGTGDVLAVNKACCKIART